MARRTYKTRLARQNVGELINAPDTSTIVGLRDRAFIVTALCTGLRLTEILALEVRDLDWPTDDGMAVWSDGGNGNKARSIPYVPHGDNDWFLPLVYEWLDEAGITSGPVLRGFFKGGRIRPTALSPRGAELIMERYQITGRDGKPVTVTAADLRHTYGCIADEMCGTQARKRWMGHELDKTDTAYTPRWNGEPPPDFYGWYA